MTTRTEMRPIPAQWMHLMKKLQKAKVFDDLIQASQSKSIVINWPLLQYYNSQI